MPLKPEPQIDTTTTLQPSCPKCGSRKVWRDAKRFTKLGDEIQRWYCRECGRRFSDPEDVANARSTFERLESIESKSLKTPNGIVNSSQICVKETKNLAAEQQKTEVLRRNRNSYNQRKNRRIRILALKTRIRRVNY